MKNSDHIFFLYHYSYTLIVNYFKLIKQKWDHEIILDLKLLKNLNSSRLKIVKEYNKSYSIP